MVTLQKKSKREEEEEERGEYECEKVNPGREFNKEPPSSMNVQQIETVPSPSSSFALPPIEEKEKV